MMVVLAQYPPTTTQEGVVVAHLPWVVLVVLCWLETEAMVRPLQSLGRQ
jgi:hypothetical protein